MRVAKPAIEPGAELDGFTIGERVHQGGMATLCTMTHFAGKASDALSRESGQVGIYWRNAPGLA